MSCTVVSSPVLSCLPPLLTMVHVKRSTVWISRLQVWCCQPIFHSCPVLCSPVLYCPAHFPVLSCPVMSTVPTGHGPCEASTGWVSRLQVLHCPAHLPVLSCPVLSSLPPLRAMVHVKQSTGWIYRFQYNNVQPSSCPVLSCLSCLLPPLNHDTCEALNWLDLEASGIVLSSPFSIFQSCPVLSCPVLSCPVLSVLSLASPEPWSM
jgi:hypothetical protein